MANEVADYETLGNASQYLSTKFPRSFSQLCGYVVLSILLYLVSCVIYNLTFHYLARIPGPKIAGATKLYQTFWGTYQRKSLFFAHVEDLHRQSDTSYNSHNSQRSRTIRLNRLGEDISYQLKILKVR